MTQFAKLYETERGQIVVIRQTNDDGDPEIRFFFMPNTNVYGVCSMALAFPPRGTGEDEENDAHEAADAAFSALTEEGVKREIFKQMDRLEEALAELGA
ncbi:hypothetical protein [Dokdonella sp.]|uniref:hypothetical protein n=1 Tax=Dokdonella sp. TaxID=2291710 RepID=UPI0031C6843E|nr:hypothetical protein [Dokdonella sp.]